VHTDGNKDEGPLDRFKKKPLVSMLIATGVVLLAILTFANQIGEQLTKLLAQFKHPTVPVVVTPAAPSPSPTLAPATDLPLEVKAGPRFHRFHAKAVGGT